MNNFLAPEVYKHKYQTQKKRYMKSNLNLTKSEIYIEKTIKK